MAEEKFQMLEKSSKMSTREAMIALAGRPPSYGELPRWLTKVSKAAGISFRTARSLWNEEIKDPEHLAARAVRQQAQIEEAKRDAAIVANFFSRRAQALANIDADFHRSEIDALLEAVRIVSSRDRA
jgi:chlorite dismutase